MSSKASMHKKITVSSNISSVESLCQRLLEEVKDRDYDKEDVFAIHLALEEAFVNAVKHGNKQDANRQIEVKYFVTPDKFDIFIADQGSGFEPDVVPDPRCEENLYKCSGRGMLLMRSYMDVVEYNGKGNRVHMIKYKGVEKREVRRK